MAAHSTNPSKIFPRLLIASAPFAFGLLALGFGQDVNWDLRNYHFYNPYAYLTGRMGFDIATAHVATYYNPLMYVPFYWAVTSLPPKAVGFMLGFIPGFNFWLLYEIARQAVGADRREHAVWFCLATALVGMLGAMNLAEIGTSYGDNILSLPVLTAVFLVLKFREQMGGRGLFGHLIAGAAGFLTGAAFGLKLPFGVYAVALCAAFFGLKLPFRRRLALAFAFGLGVLGGAALTGGFWMAEMWRRFQNPLFPYFNEYFHSPWGAVGSYRDERFVPKSLGMALVFPIWFNIDPMQVGEVPFRDLRFPLLYLLLLALLAKAVLARLRPSTAVSFTAAPGPERMPATAVVVIFMVVAFLLWMKLFGVYRYLMVAEMLAPLAVFLVLGALLGDSRRQMRAAAVCLLVLLVSLAPGNWGRRAWSAEYFGFQPPVLSDPQHTLVLMTGHDAMAYMIPFFPPEVRFLRIQGYFTGPSDKPNLSDRKMRDIVARHVGPLFVLYREYEQWQARTALAAYGLMPAPGASCRRFVPEVEPQPEHLFYFCEVKKLRPDGIQDSQ